MGEGHGVSIGECPAIVGQILGIGMILIDIVAIVIVKTLGVQILPGIIVTGVTQHMAVDDVSNTVEDILLYLLGSCQHDVRIAAFVELHHFLVAGNRTHQADAHTALGKTLLQESIREAHQNIFQLIHHFRQHRNLILIHQFIIAGNSQRILSNRYMDTVFILQFLGALGTLLQALDVGIFPGVERLQVAVVIAGSRHGRIPAVEHLGLTFHSQDPDILIIRCHRNRLTYTHHAHLGAVGTGGKIIEIHYQCALFHLPAVTAVQLEGCGQMLIQGQGVVFSANRTVDLLLHHTFGAADQVMGNTGLQVGQLVSIVQGLAGGRIQVEHAFAALLIDDLAGQHVAIQMAGDNFDTLADLALDNTGNAGLQIQRTDFLILAIVNFLVGMADARMSGDILRDLHLCCLL